MLNFLLLLPTELCCVITKICTLPILASQILIPDYCDRHFLGVATVTSCQLLGSRDELGAGEEDINFSSSPCPLVPLVPPCPLDSRLPLPVNIRKETERVITHAGCDCRCGAGWASNCRHVGGCWLGSRDL
ncbi:MAG: hypothetical protein CLLPBCKN_003875 [Chroococcidiopsis cubana SAG 39.79]|nr:hypothetical protein [Chroococcidiopsis cubana SAG 39.79]